LQIQVFGSICYALVPIKLPKKMRDNAEKKLMVGLRTTDISSLISIQETNVRFTTPTRFLNDKNGKSKDNNDDDLDANEENDDKYNNVEFTRVGSIHPKDNSALLVFGSKSLVAVEKSRGSVNYSSRSTDIVNAELPISKETYTDHLVQGKDIQGPLKSCNNRPIPDQGSVMPFPSDTIGPERKR
jgi:hypothetical protein